MCVASAIFVPINDYALRYKLSEGVVCIESGQVLSCQALVVRNAFAVGLELSCSEPRKAVDHPPHGQQKPRHTVLLRLDTRIFPC